MIAGIVTFQIQNRVAQEAEIEATAPTQVASRENTSRTIDFELPDIDGNVRQLSEWNGKARLVNFWATWCAPCRREIPLLKATQTAHGDADVQVIGIAVDFPEEVAAYAEEAEFNYPILVGQEEAMAAAESSGVEFIGMPFTMVIAPDGELLTTHIGEIVEAHIDTIISVMRSELRRPECRHQSTTACASL